MRRLSPAGAAAAGSRCNGFPVSACLPKSVAPLSLSHPWLSKGMPDQRQCFGQFADRNRMTRAACMKSVRK